VATPQKRRRLRFNLRTALLLFTAAAIAVWLYWDGWQRWQWSVDQRKFVESAKLLRAGSFISDDWKPPLTYQYPFPPWLSGGGRHDRYGHYHRHSIWRWPNIQFVVYWQFDGSYSTSVEVFRLPVAPRDYQPQTESSREYMRRGVPPLPPEVDREAYLKANSPAKGAYLRDFLHMIQGDRKDSMGFNYELIHSDFIEGTPSMPGSADE
jgi:hypothetical protein